MISSRENGVVKLCRRLQSSGRARREEGLFLAEGSRLCREAVSAGLSVSALLATPEALEKNPWLEEPGRGELLLISQGVAKAISDTQSPQGVFCLCALPQERELSLQEGGRYLLLDRLQDPGNLGTIIRGAEAFGVTALVLGPGCPDCFSPKVLRSTMGSLFRQPVFHTGDLPGSIRRMGEEGFAVYAAMLDPAGRREVLDTVKTLNRDKGITVVLITHHMDEAAMTDRVVVMDRGRVVMDGPPREILVRMEELREIGLDAPHTVELLHGLRQEGFDVPLDALGIQECAEAILRALA